MSTSTSTCHTAGATAPRTAIILAAGEGTRMKSKHSKVTHAVLGRPMVIWVVEAARAAGCDRIVVVVGSHADEVRAILDAHAGRTGVALECVEQAERLGTGHAVRVALEQAGVAEGQVLVLCGDTPLLRGEALAALMDRASGAAGGTGLTSATEANPADTAAEGEACGAAACGGAPAGVPTAGPADAHALACGGALLTMTYADPTGYGRVMTDADGLATAIVEQKDCTPEEALVTTCNAGVYSFDAALLATHIGELTQENAQHEYYLTDMTSVLAAAGAPMRAVSCEEVGATPDDLMGVNSRVQLAAATRVMQARINECLMLSGVTMLDPTSVWVGPEVEIGRDTEILPGCILMGDTVVGEDCVIGPDTRLTDTRVGDRCVVDETVAVGAVLEDDVESGPRAYLRPGAHLLEGSKAGTHVEIKKSTIGRGSKVPHLSYVGDAEIGEGVNLGAGTITCNYDGKNKNRTTIGDDTFVGSSTMLVAPVNVGSGCTIGAGSVITSDVPDGALAVARGRQVVKEGWFPRWKRE